MIKGYFADMREVIRQCGLCLEKDKVYIVIDQSAYVGVIIPTDLLLAYISESVGFNVVSITECRKARTSTQQLKKYPYLKNVLRESIVELIKIRVEKLPQRISLCSMIYNQFLYVIKLLSN